VYRFQKSPHEPCPRKALDQKDYGHPPCDAIIIMPVRIAAVIAFFIGIVVGASASTTIRVGQRGAVFSQSSASLTKGDSMVFTNEDDVIHNIHVFGPGSDESSDLGLQRPRAVLTYRYDMAGSYRVRCNLHPSMKMVVTVK
jgi:plastocyanin